MAFCKHCGAQIPDHAKFCPKCGVAGPLGSLGEEPVISAVDPTEVAQQQPEVTQQQQATVTQQQQPVQPAYVPPPQPQQPPRKNTDYKGWFGKNALILYVLTGVLAYMLTELAAAYMTMSEGFCITLAVFAIIFGLAFVAVAVIDFVIWFAERNAELRSKSRVKHIIMLIIGIIVFVYVLMMCIVVFDSASTYWDAMNAMNGII